MTVSQMTHHCQLPFNVILEKVGYRLKPNFSVNLFFKKSIYSDIPWRKNLATAHRFRASENRDFKKKQP